MIDDHNTYDDPTNGHLENSEIETPIGGSESIGSQPFTGSIIESDVHHQTFNSTQSDNSTLTGDPIGLSDSDYLGITSNATPTHNAPTHFGAELDAVLKQQAVSLNIDNDPTLDVSTEGHSPVTTYNDQLDVSDSDSKAIQEKADGIDRAESKKDVSFGKKLCATRGGCQGATDCNYSYGSYPG